jgi:nicotinamide riboside transporter PnuC
MWIETIGTIATVLAVAGVVANNHRRIACFYFWLVSNALTLLCHVALGAWSLAVRDAIFWFLAIYGLVCWSRAARAALTRPGAGVGEG